MSLPMILYFLAGRSHCQRNFPPSDKGSPVSHISINNTDHIIWFIPYNGVYKLIALSATKYLLLIDYKLCGSRTLPDILLYNLGTYLPRSPKGYRISLSYLGGIAMAIGHTVTQGRLIRMDPPWT